MAKLLTVVHPDCKKEPKVAYYVTAFPIGREMEYFDALTEFGMKIAMMKRVECLSCGEKLDFAAINKYYEE